MLAVWNVPFAKSLCPSSRARRLRSRPSVAVSAALTSSAALEELPDGVRSRLLAPRVSAKPYAPLSDVAADLQLPRPAAEAALLALAAATGARLEPLPGDGENDDDTLYVFPQAPVMWSRLEAERLRGVLDVGLVFNREPYDATFSLASFQPFLFVGVFVLPATWMAMFNFSTLFVFFWFQSVCATFFLIPPLLAVDTHEKYTAAVSASRAARDAEVASLRADAAANGGRLSSLHLARSLPALVGLADPFDVAAACAVSARAGREETVPPGAVLVAACALRASPRVVADGGGGGLPAVVWDVLAGQGWESGADDDDTAPPIARLWSALVNAAGAAAAAVTPPSMRSAAAGEVAADAQRTRDDAESSRNEFFAQFSPPLTAAVLAAQGTMAAALAVAYCARFDVGGAGDSTSWWLLPLLTVYSLLCFAPAVGWHPTRRRGARPRTRRRFCAAAAQHASRARSTGRRRGCANWRRRISTRGCGGRGASAANGGAAREVAVRELYARTNALRDDDQRVL